MKIGNSGVLFIGSLIVLLIVLLVSFLFFSGVVWVITWAFGIPFMWKYVFGAYAVVVLVRMIVRK